MNNEIRIRLQSEVDIERYSKWISELLPTLGIPADYGRIYRLPLQAEACQLKSIGKDVYERGQEMLPEAADAWLTMHTNATEQGIELQPVSAFRSVEYQVEILRRKLAVVQKRYKRNQLDFEKNAVIAISSIYGIDILEDNVGECKSRLFEIFDDTYTSLYKRKSKDTMRESVKYILDKNIIHGDALTLKADDGKPITFSEWSMISGSMIKRRDYHFESLSKSETKDVGLFTESTEELSSDLGDDAFIPKPDKTYRSIHFLRIADVG